MSAWSLALLAWLTLHWGILPRLDEWRPQIEARASAALGAPVRIGALRVRSSGWVPSFEIDDLRVLDGQGRDALHLARVVAALSPQSLLVLEPRFAQLLIEDVSLDLRRDRDGRFFVAGLDMRASDEPADPAALDWLLEQQELVIRRGTLRWTDELIGAPPLALVGRRPGAAQRRAPARAAPGRHAAAGVGRPLHAAGRSSRSRCWPRPANGTSWSGEAYLALPRADVAQLRQHVELPFELSEGRGALRAWVTIADGRPAQTVADVALAAVAMRLAPSLPPLTCSGWRAASTRGRTSAACPSAPSGCPSTPTTAPRGRRPRCA